MGQELNHPRAGVVPSTVRLAGGIALSAYALNSPPIARAAEPDHVFVINGCAAPPPLPRCQLDRPAHTSAAASTWR